MSLPCARGQEPALSPLRRERGRGREERGGERRGGERGEGEREERGRGGEGEMGSLTGTSSFPSEERERGELA